MYKTITVNFSVNPVTIIFDTNNKYFRAKDITSVLQYKDPNAYHSHCKELKIFCDNEIIHNPDFSTDSEYYLTESDVYRLLVRSMVPNIKIDFKDWLYIDVYPLIDSLLEEPNNELTIKSIFLKLLEEFKQIFHEIKTNR